MANENHQHDVVPSTDAAQQPLASLDAIALGQKGASRRRFTRAGAGATGVLLTLASQPGMACDICMAPSGYQSYSKTMKAASHTGAPVTCQGRSPTYWKGTTSWPSSCHSTTMFNKVFSCNSVTNRTYGATSCMKILTPQSFDSAGVGVYLMACYLNVLKGWTSFLTIEQVRAIWTEYQATGYYTPTAGTKWNASQIVFYLSGTMY